MSEVSASFAFEQLEPSAPPDPNEPERILAYAAAQAGRVLEHARAQGREQGLAEGRELGLAQTSSAAQALDRALGEIESAQAELASSLEHSAVELAFDLAAKIVAGALEAQPERVLDVIAGALRSCGERRRITVLVDPDDLELVTGSIEQLRGRAGGVESCEVQSDRRVGAGGAIVRTAEGEIDARLAMKLERAREIVRAALSEPEPAAGEGRRRSRR